jgi:hypothetical protein
MRYWLVGLAVFILVIAIVLYDEFWTPPAPPMPVVDLHRPGDKIKETPGDAIEKAWKKVFQEKLHPTLQEDPWRHVDRDSKAGKRSEKEIAVEELHLNGADLTTDEGGEVTIVNLSHLKPRKPRKDIQPGLALLERLPHLRAVYLYNTLADDEAAEQLRSLSQLRELELGWTSTTDKGLEQLKGLTRLEVLGLGTTNITDAGLKHLAGMTRLRILVLVDTNITDAGIADLRALSSLKELRLSGTKISRSGLAELKRRLPQCEIQMVGGDTP